MSCCSNAWPSSSFTPKIRPAWEARYSPLRPEPACRRTRTCGTGGSVWFSSSEKSGKAQLLARVHDGMLGNQPAHALFHLIREGVVGGSQVGKLGLAADRRNAACVQEGGFRGQAAKRTVRMPHAISHFEHALAALFAPDLRAWV